MHTTHVRTLKRENMACTDNIYSDRMTKTAVVEKNSCDFSMWVEERRRKRGEGGRGRDIDK